MSRAGTVLIAALVLQPVILASAAAPTIITQLGRAFAVKEVRIRRGDTLRFVNADEFLHHVYVRSPSFNFNSGEQEPGRNVDVQFPIAGKFEVRCEIHPRMLLTVSVE